MKKMFKLPNKRWASLSALLLVSMTAMGLQSLASASDNTTDTGAVPAVLTSIAVSPANPSVASGQTERFTARALDQDGNIMTEAAFTWGIASSQTDAGAIDPGTGDFTAGTVPGTYINAIEAQSGDVTGTTSVTVTSVPLGIASLSLVDGEVGADYSQSLSAAGGTSPYTWSIVDGSLPDGLSLSGYTISGVPAVAGTFSFTAEVTDSASPTPNTLIRDLSITLLPAASTPPDNTTDDDTVPAVLASIAVSPADPSVVSGQTERFAAQGLDQDGNIMTELAFTWDIASSQTDAGAIDPGTGDFTAGTLPGTYTDAIRVKSGDVTGATSVTVTPAALGIASLSLAGGQVGVDYLETLAATGGTSPYTWSIIAGSPPDGLSLNGDTISGVPATAGTASFTAEVIDSASPTPNTLTRELSITVIPAAATTPDNTTETTSFIVRLVAGLNVVSQQQVITRDGGLETSSVPALRMHFIEVPSASADEVMRLYQSDSQVQSIELDKVRKVEGAPSDPSYPEQWALPKIGWDSVFGSVTPTGSSVIAILDTGIDASHPDLGGLVLSGYSAFEGFDAQTDPNGHGTEMAGIAAALTNNDIGVSGVAYAGVSLLPVQVLGADGTGQDSDIISGIVWATDHGANVILMAFSNPGYSLALQEAIDYAWDQGAILIAAVGNDGVNTVTYPAGDRGVIGVSATDPNDALASSSNYGEIVFLAAPGVSLPTTSSSGGYTAVSGTSASAAIVAGAAAFMHAVDPGLNNGVIVGRLARTADPVGTQEQTGNGRINMARALSDTGTDPVQPTGAPPLGDGGPYVGPYVAAATITSTAAGGAWNTGSTWVGGVVPGTGDTVIIATTGAGAVEIDTNLTQTAAGSVTVNNGATLSMQTTGVTVTLGALTINSGGIFTVHRQLTVLGATSITGTINFGSTSTTVRNMTFTGAVTLNSGAVWNETTTGAAATFSFGNSLANNATTFTAQNTAHNFTGTSMTISGTTATSIPTVTFTGNYTNSGTLSVSALLTVTGAAIRLTNNGIITATTALSGTGGVTQGATGILNIGAASAITTLTATAVGNTVNYTGAAQTAKVTTYYNLTLSGSGAKTFATTPTVSGVLSLEGTAIVVVTTGVVTYGANATLKYNTATARTATAEEWITPFAATGGVVIASTGTITLNAAKIFNSSAPLTINSGATLAMSTYLLTLNGNLVNNGGTTSGSGGVTIAGTATQSIGGFTNTGTVTMTKTAGTATLTGAMSAGPLTMNGVGGTLNLGTGLTHTVTNVTLTNGTLNCGSSALNVSGTWTGTSGFTSSTGTINYNGSAQAIAAVTYNNLTINQSSGNATLGSNATVNGILALTGGNLTVTDPNVLTMGASATTTGAGDVTGIVKRTTLVPNTAYTFGNQYTTVDFQNVGTLPTEMSFRITIGSTPAWKTGAVQRKYDFIQTGGSGTYATLNLHYLDAELNGNTENRLVYWRCLAPFTPGTEIEFGRSNYDTTNNWVGISSVPVHYWPATFGGVTLALGDSLLSSATWNGSNGTVWGYPDNWTPSGVPSDVSAVVIPDASTTPNDPTLPTGALTLAGLTIYSGGILNSAASTTLTISGDGGAWINDGGTFNPSTGTVIFTNAAATIAGATDFYNVTINSGAALMMGTGGTMRIGGTMTNNGVWNVSTGTHNTVEYNGGSQTVLNPNGPIPGYHYLILSGSGTKTMPVTALTLDDDFLVSGTASATAGAAINTTGSFIVESDASFATGAFTHTIVGNLAVSGTLTSSSSAAINLAGDYSVSGTLSPDTLNMVFNGAGDQTVTGTVTWHYITVSKSSGTLFLTATPTLGGAGSGIALTAGNIAYNGVSQNVLSANHPGNVTLSGSGAKTLQTGTTTIGGNLTLSGTATTTTVVGLGIGGNLGVGDGTSFTAAGFALTVTGTTTIGGGTSGNLTVSSAAGAKTFTGLVTVSAGGTWNNSGDSPITFRGGITNSGTFVAGTGMQTFDTNSQALNGTFSMPSVTITGVALTNNGTLSVTTALVGTGGLANAATGTLSIGLVGPPGITTLTTTATGNTVNYNLGGAQTVFPTTYSNLTLSGSGAKSFPAGTTTMNGVLSMEGTATTTLTGTLAYGASATLQYNGSAAQTTGTEFPVAGVPNLTINNSNGVTASGDLTVSGTLDLSSANPSSTKGALDMSAFTINMGASATNIGAAGDVTGIVKRTSFVAGTSYSFGNQYTTINFQNTGTLPTDVSVKITIGSAPAWKTGAILRTYDIIRTGGIDNSATVNLHYLDAELNGNTENDLVWWGCETPFTPGTGAGWGRSNYDTTNNWVGLANSPISLWPTSFAQKVETLGDSVLSDSTWNGSTNTEWMLAANWTPNGVPSDSTVVVIPDASTTTYAPTLPNSSITLNTLTIESGGILNSAATSVITVSGATGAWTNIGGTFNPSTSTVIFTNAAATIAGTTDFYNVTINPGVVLVMGSNTTMRIAGTMTNNGTWRTVFAGPTTVEYNGGDQTVVVPNPATNRYSTLILSGSGTKTMPGTALEIVGDFSMSETASATAGAAINTTGSVTLGPGTSFTTGAFSYTIGGDFSNSGTFTAAGSTITLNGSASQIVGGDSTTAFDNLTINNANGITLNNSPTINGTLTLTSGNITTGSDTVIIGNSGSVSRTSGHVVGNLQKNVATGATSRTFEVGTTGGYDPVTVAFGNVGTPGDLTAKATAGEQPDIGASAINSSKDVNVYWTLTGAGIEFDNCSATFNFNNPGDIDGSAAPANFVVGTYNSGWTYPTVGTLTGTSTQATGMTSLLGDFAVGEPVPSPSIEYVKLYDTGGTPAEVTAMTPQVQYDVRVKVADADGLADLTTIVVKLWYDANGDIPSESEFIAAAANTQNCAIITWTGSGGSGSFALTAMSGTTWSLGTGVTPTDLSGEFQFKFIPGKVATETTGSANWQIAVKVTDDFSQTAFAYDTDTATNDMNWYGEIDVPTRTVDWGTVNPGMNFAEGDPSEETLGVTVKYISNGAYDEKVKSSSPWTGGSGATLDADGACTVANHFALMADDTGTLSSAILVNTTGVTIDDSGTQTDEAGHAAANNTLWLKLASTFTKPTYTGTITYIIADGT